MSKQPPPAPTVSAVGPCPTIMQSVGVLLLLCYVHGPKCRRPGTGSLTRTMAPPDQPRIFVQNFRVNMVADIDWCSHTTHDWI